MDRGSWYCTVGSDQDQPQEKEMQKGKMVVWGGLSWEKKRNKGEKERYTHLNAEFQRIAQRDKKGFLSDQCKEIEENNRMGKTRELSWRRQWHPTPVLLPGRSHGWRSLEGCGPWGHWGSDTIEQLQFYFSLPLFTFMHWRRKWQPTPVFLPGESQGRGSLVGCHLWGHTELDTTEMT